MNLTITFHHTTSDDIKIYHLQDLDKATFNDGRSIIFSDKVYCEQLRDKLIKQANTPNYIQERMIL